MRPQELELLVRGRIQALRANQRVEDDRLELKRAWPDPAKAARQLAASANRLAGDWLILIVGIDEKTGEVHPPGDLDPGDWFAQVVKTFDDRVAPHLVRQQLVAVGDDQYVTAVLLSTDQYPYVVNRNDGSRDLLVRSGAITRSAHRHELLDLLRPTLELPRMTISSASVTVTQERTHWSGRPEDLTYEAELKVSVAVKVFLEYIGDGAVVIPQEGVHVRLRGSDGFESRLQPYFWTGSSGTFVRVGQPAPQQPAPPRFAVYVRDKQVVATAPGSFIIQANDTSTHSGPVPMDHPIVEAYADADAFSLDLVLSVAGTRRLAHLTTPLTRVAPVDEPTEEAFGQHTKTTWHLGRWEMPTAFYDPWAQEDQATAQAASG